MSGKDASEAGARQPVQRRTKSGRYAADLQREELEQYFYLPVEEASERLGVGLTVLKSVCRKYNIGRWPYRKVRRIQWLAERIKAGYGRPQCYKALKKLIDELDVAPTSPVWGVISVDYHKLMREINNAEHAQGSDDPSAPNDDVQMNASPSHSDPSSRGHLSTPRESSDAAAEPSSLGAAGLQPVATQSMGGLRNNALVDLLHSSGSLLSSTTPGVGSRVNIAGESARGGEGVPSWVVDLLYSRVHSGGHAAQAAVPFLQELASLQQQPPAAHASKGGASELGFRSAQQASYHNEPFAYGQGSRLRSEQAYDLFAPRQEQQEASGDVTLLTQLAKTFARDPAAGYGAGPAPESLLGLEAKILSSGFPREFRQHGSGSAALPVERGVYAGEAQPAQGASGGLGLGGLQGLSAQLLERGMQYSKLLDPRNPYADQGGLDEVILLERLRAKHQHEAQTSQSLPQQLLSHHFGGLDTGDERLPFYREPSKDARLLEQLPQRHPSLLDTSRQGGPSQTSIPGERKQGMDLEAFQRFLAALQQQQNQPPPGGVQSPSESDRLTQGFRHLP